MDDLFQQSVHRRWNPLKGDWVIVSPHRMQRPWQGQVEGIRSQEALRYDPTCYLCPGNVRAGGETTPHYTETFVFDNDYAAIQDNAAPAIFDRADAGLLRAETESGSCRVLCFDPRHDLTMATMSVAGIRRVVDVWAAEEAALAEHAEVQYIQIFENRGAMMGASNAHPHGQIWATQHIPNEPSLELASQGAYYAARNVPLLMEYLKLELQEQERLVAQNDEWVALVPFWAVWPFELLLLPRAHLTNFREMPAAVRDGLAAMLRTVTAAYDSIFDTPFPYSMGFHCAPCDGGNHPEWVMHAHFYPPLLRSATVRKFMVGFELLGSPQRDITPEAAAAVLRLHVKETEV